MATQPRVYALSPLAEQDLEAIYLYTLRTWSREQALSYHSDLVAAFEGLAAGTKRGRPAIIRDAYLKLPVGSHMVFFRIAHDTIEIIRVLHQSMDAPRHLKP